MLFPVARQAFETAQRGSNPSEAMTSSLGVRSEGPFLGSFVFTPPPADWYRVRVEVIPVSS